MPEVSLTTFVDFMAAVGPARLTVVRKAKDLYEKEYSPAFDFWRALRVAIVELHRSGGKTHYLDRAVAQANDRQKPLYADRAGSYKKWLGRKKFAWIGCAPADWTHGALTVKVNPELCVGINGEVHLIKLYFKARELSKPGVDTTLHLIAQARIPEGKDITPAIMDVARARLIPPTRDIPGIGALLAGEAAAFTTMWREL